MPYLARAIQAVMHTHGLHQVGLSAQYLTISTVEIMSPLDFKRSSENCQNVVDAVIDFTIHTGIRSEKSIFPQGLSETTLSSAGDTGDLITNTQVLPNLFLLRLLSHFRISTVIILPGNHVQSRAEAFRTLTDFVMSIDFILNLRLYLSCHVYSQSCEEH